MGPVAWTRLEVTVADTLAEAVVRSQDVES